MQCCAAWADARFYKWSCYTGLGRGRENETRICSSCAFVDYAGGAIHHGCVVYLSIYIYENKYSG